LLAGAVLGSRDLVDAIRGLQGITGAVVDPFAAYCWCAAQDVRLEDRAAEQNAQAVAEFLAAHPRVEARPLRGLPSSPEHDVAQEADAGIRRCGVLRGAGRSRRDITGRGRLPDPVPRGSLGGVESLIEQPAIMSFYELTSEERLEIGIKDNLIRYSVGIEDADDLIADLAQALG
jgi:cystathionine gamma-synthase